METFKVMKTTWDELSSLGYSSVTDYCRMLVKDYPEELPNRIEVYRGDMLCFSVHDIRVMAALEPTGSRFQKHTPRRQSKGRGCVKNEK